MSVAIVEVVSDGLKNCEDSNTFLAVKLSILRFEQTLEVSPGSSLFNDLS